MKKEKKAGKSNHEKRIIYSVFGTVLIIFLLIIGSFILRLLNVEKNNPVSVSEDFSFVTYEGSYFYPVTEVPDSLKAVEINWLGGARLENASRLNQAFRDRYSYALYTDEEMNRYIWVKDGDFYKDGFTWADWEKDYPFFDQFENSYFYKER